MGQYKTCAHTTLTASCSHSSGPEMNQLTAKILWFNFFDLFVIVDYIYKYVY